MMKSPLLSLPGAAPAEGPDEGVAAHYGDLFREQRALADGTGFVDLSHRPVVAVSGADRLSWLHLLLTQHVSELPPGQATEALILSAHGHIEHALYLVDDATTTWMHVEPGTQGDLLAYLESMRFFYRVEPRDATDDYAVVHLPAGSIAAVPDGWAVRETPYGRDVFVPRGELESYAAEMPPPAFRGHLPPKAGGGKYPLARRDHSSPTAALSRNFLYSAGPPIGALALEALRIEAHRPRLGLETDHRTIPHEVGWLETAVHLDKGCYRGQETVARVHNLGRPPRRLVFLHLDGSEVKLPGHGTPVRLAEEGSEGRQIGFITSSARHYELGPIALALVKRNVPADAVLLAGTVPANQEVVVAP